LAEHEKAALAAVDRMKALGVIKSKKADWRLVAAAQALRRRDFADEIDAARAMGKEIKQCRDVEKWSTHLKELEERERQQNDTTLTRSGSMSSMLVQPKWVEMNLPGLTQVAADAVVLSANKRHGKRVISAVAATPGGSTRAVSTTVSYTLPPPEGESDTAAKRRRDRHREREERKLRSMDLSEAAAEHRKQEAERAQAEREAQRAAEREREEVIAALSFMLTRVEQLNGWTEDRSFHWLPLSLLQLMDWPSRLGYTASLACR